MTVERPAIIGNRNGLFGIVIHIPEEGQAYPARRISLESMGLFGLPEPQKFGMRTYTWSPSSVDPRINVLN